MSILIPQLYIRLKNLDTTPKQLHHIIRLKEFIDRYTDSEPFADCLIAKNKAYLINVKKGLHTLEEARKLATEGIQNIKKIKGDYISNTSRWVNVQVENILNNIVINTMKQWFKEELEVKTK